MPDCSLPRKERLRNVGAVQRLFRNGTGGFVYPFRYVFFAEAGTEPAVRVLFSVPKKFHKRANRRNLLRRRTKEAYRLNKTLLAGGNSASVDLALIYSGSEVTEYARIEHAVRKILEQIAGRL